MFLPFLFSPPSTIRDLFVSSVLDLRQPFQVVRIPALCKTKRGTLLAFAEGRKTVSDQSGNQLVMRRLPRGAQDWSDLQTIRNEDPASLNNPCVLATREGRVWMMYQRYPAGFGEFTCKPGMDPNKSCLSFVIHSDDDGLTWSDPVDISSDIKGPKTRSLASGPGVGIELQSGPHKGRLLFPFNKGVGADFNVFSVFSDDDGQTWRRGPTAFRFSGTNPNENQVAEIDGGGVFLNCRNQATGRHRLTSTSVDGGEIWDIVQPRPDLPDPVCMGSTVTLRLNPHVLAFSNSGSSTRDRHSGTVRLSFDGGATWPVSTLLVNGSFEYSCLCPLSDHTLGMLYETRETGFNGHPGYRIKYRTIELKAGRQP